MRLSTFNKTAALHNSRGNLCDSHRWRKPCVPHWRTSPDSTGRPAGRVANRSTFWIARARRLFGRYTGQRFRCLLARLAHRSVRNRMFAEGAGGHVTLNTSWLANMHILSAMVTTTALARTQRAHLVLLHLLLLLLLPRRGTVSRTFRNSSGDVLSL
jgi:hypothetical protein